MLLLLKLKAQDNASRIIKRGGIEKDTFGFFRQHHSNDFLGKLVQI
jgi:hypothetical protein